MLPLLGNEFQWASCNHSPVPIPIQPSQQALLLEYLLLVTQGLEWAFIMTAQPGIFHDIHLPYRRLVQCLLPDMGTCSILHCSFSLPWVLSLNFFLIAQVDKKSSSADPLPNSHPTEKWDWRLDFLQANLISTNLPLGVPHWLIIGMEGKDTEVFWSWRFPVQLFPQDQQLESQWIRLSINPKYLLLP